MAVIIDGKVYRNLPEQVLANQKNIEDIIRDKLPDLVTTDTEQTVSAKKSFTDTIEVKGAEINAETMVGTYPSSIDATVILNVNRVAADLVALEKVDFENHTISKGAWLYFVYPKTLRKNYGLHGPGGASSAPFSSYTLNKDVSIPETITTEEQLKAYIKSSDFASAVDSAGYTIYEYFILNDVATYHSDIQSIYFNGATVVGDDSLDCQEGVGKQIVGAAEPITEPALKTKNLKVENLEVGTEGNHVAKAVYVHKISWKYVSNTPNIYLCYLSTNPSPYSSMADIFSHRNDTDLTTSEVAEYNEQSAILKFSPTGAILNAVAISAGNGNVNTFAMIANGFSFDKDEVVSD